MIGKTLDWQTTTLAAAPLLKSGQVHLWWLALDIDEPLNNHWENLLTPIQRQRWQRLKAPQQKARYVAGRGYLQLLLRHYLQTEDPVDLAFTDKGKPHVADSSYGLRFNTSDTCGYALMAFTKDVEVGVDVESLARRGNFERIANKMFSAEELAAINPADDTHFLACWTRKEAFGKALGVGLHYPTQQHTLCRDVEINDFVTADRHWFGQQLLMDNMPGDFVSCVVAEQFLDMQAFLLDGSLGHD